MSQTPQRASSAIGQGNSGAQTPTPGDWGPQPADPLRTPKSLSKSLPETPSQQKIGARQASSTQAHEAGQPSTGSSRKNPILIRRETRKRPSDFPIDNKVSLPPFKIKVVERPRRYATDTCSNTRCLDLQAKFSRLEQEKHHLREMIDMQDVDIVTCKLQMRRYKEALSEKQEKVEGLEAENTMLLEMVAFLEQALSEAECAATRSISERSPSPTSGYVGSYWDGQLISGRKTVIGDLTLIPKHPLDATKTRTVISAVDITDVFMDPKEVAMKLFSKHEEARFRNECAILARLGDQGIVPRLFSAFETASTYVVIMGKYEASLLHRPAPTRPIPDSCRRVVKEILRQVELLHSNGYVNFNINPRNIVFSAKGDIALGDSTLACTIAAGKKAGIRGLKGFMAPEVVSGKELNRPCAADVWSIGAILAWLLGKPLSSPIHDYKMVSSAVNRVFGRYRDPDAHDFLEKILCPFPTRRMTAKQALNHKWLEGVAVDSPLESDWMHKLPINRHLEQEPFSFQFSPGPVIPIVF